MDDIYLSNVPLNGLAYNIKKMFFVVDKDTLCVIWNSFPCRLCFPIKDIKRCEEMLKGLENYKKCGVLKEEEFVEIRDRVISLSNLAVGGKERIDIVSVDEAAKVVFRDGKRVVINTRKRKVVPTQAQVNAAINASKYAHTAEAEEKRRKSLNARREAKLFGDV